MAPHSSTLAWKIPWTEKPDRLQPMGSRRVGHDWATSLSLFTFMHWRRKWQPNSSVLAWRIPGTGELGGLPSVGLHRVGHDWSNLAAAAAAAILFTRALPKSPISKHHRTRHEISRYDWGEESTEMSYILFPLWKPRYALNHPRSFPGEASIACREPLISIGCLQAGHAFQTWRHPGFSELGRSKLTLLWRAQGLSLAGREQWRSWDGTGRELGAAWKENALVPLMSLLRFHLWLNQKLSESFTLS